MADAKSAKGLVTSEDLSTYHVKSYSKRGTSNNQSFVSTQTGGKTHRVPGNRDVGWDISLFADKTSDDVPVALREGNEITVKLENEDSSHTMIVDEASLEVNVETGELIGISLTCSAVDDSSYDATS